MDRILRAVLTKEGQSVSEKAAVVRGICGSVAASGPAGVQAVGAALIQLAVGGSGEVPVEVAGPCLRAAAAACSGVTTHWLSHPPVVDMLTCMVREGVDVTADPRGHVALAVVVGVLRRLSGEAGARWAQLDGPLGAFVEAALPALVPAAVTLPVIEDVVCMLGCGEGMAAFHRLPVAAQANALVQWLGIVPYCSATAAPGPVPGVGTQAQLRASLVTLLQLMWSDGTRETSLAILAALFRLLADCGVGAEAVLGQGVEDPGTLRGLCDVILSAPDPVFAEVPTFLTNLGLPHLTAPQATALLTRVLVWPMAAQAALAPRAMAMLLSALPARRHTALATALAACAPAVIASALDPASWHGHWLSTLQLVLGHPGPLSPRLLPVGGVVDAALPGISTHCAVSPEAPLRCLFVLHCLALSEPATVLHPSFGPALGTAASMMSATTPSVNGSQYPWGVRDLLAACRSHVWMDSSRVNGGAAAAAASSAVGVTGTSLAPTLTGHPWWQAAPNAILPCGLQNLGNTCYMNSTLQALFANDDFVEAMLRRRLPSNDSVSLRLRKALCLLALSYQRSVSLADLHAVLPEPFNGYGQQDATEFARLLLDTLTSPEDAAPGKAPSLDDKALAVTVKRLFYGTGSTVVTCTKCGGITSSSEAFTDIAVSLPSVAPSAPLHLQHLVQGMLAPELMDGDAAYECIACAAKVPATRQLVIDDAPCTLILTLNRFRYDASAKAQVKLCHAVHVPEDLTLPLAPGSSSHALYRLYAVVLHLGSAAVYGHYTSYCRDSGVATAGACGIASGWRHCNDSSVELVSSESVVAALGSGGYATPYMMLYKRVDEAGERCGTMGGDSVSAAGAAVAAGAGAPSTSDSVIDLTTEGRDGTSASHGGMPSGRQLEALVLDRTLHQHVSAHNAEYLRRKERGEGEAGGVTSSAAPPPPPPRGFGGGGGGGRRYRPNLGFGAGRAVF